MQQVHKADETKMDTNTNCKSNSSSLSSSSNNSHNSSNSSNHNNNSSSNNNSHNNNNSSSLSIINCHLFLMSPSVFLACFLNFSLKESAAMLCSLYFL